MRHYGFLDKQPTLSTVRVQLAAHGIRLVITKKRVKNINFRIKAGVLSVSAPIGVSEHLLAQAVAARIDWAVAAMTKLHQKHQTKPTLWGETLDDDKIAQWGEQLPKKSQAKFGKLNKDEQIAHIYRHELLKVLPSLQAKWQSIVGKQASSITVRAMTSRWGSCNVRTARISLASQLAAYPKACSEYVLVHELCHLHHADHSAQFWAAVARAMPDYQHWHRLLKVGL